MQIALDIRRERAGGLVAAIAVFLESLHHDPIQLAANELAEPPWFTVAVCRHRRRSLSQRANSRAGLGRLLLADDAANLVVAGLLKPLLVERRCAGQQLIEQHTERIDV